jgi:hypothetical protein
MALLLGGCQLCAKKPNHGDGGPAACGLPAPGNCDGEQQDAPTVCGYGDNIVPMPANLAAAAAVVSNGYAYVVGGTTDTTGSAGTTHVYYVQILVDETLGNTWKSTTAIPVAGGLFKASIAASNGFIYLLGGAIPGPDFNTVQSSTFSVKANADGSLGNWVAGPPLPSARDAGAAVIVNGFLYWIGGNPAKSNGAESEGADEAQAPVYVSAIQPDGSLGAWAETAALPAGRESLAAAATSNSTGDNFIYVIGGKYFGGTVDCDPNKILVGKVNSDGTIACWSQATPFTLNVEAAGAAIIGDTLFAVGGLTWYMGAPGQNPQIVAATLNPDGSIGSEWLQVGVLPDMAIERAVAASDSAIYSFGGDPTTAGMTVPFNTSVSMLAPDGTLKCPSM